jgi:purine-binding chemotaxis protein CheW
MNAAVERIASEVVSTGQYLSFQLAGEEYAVDILRVQEIRGWSRPTPIPNAPPFVRGVINLRGAIVPIFDLRRRFGLAEQPFGPTTVVIVVRVRHEERERTVGMVVDAVSDVHDVGEAQLRAPPEFGASASAECVRALAALEERMLILLDLEKLLDSNAMPALTMACAPPVGDEPPGQGPASSRPTDTVAASVAGGERASRVLAEAISTAIAAHGKWKTRLKGAIESGTLDVPVATVRVDNGCPFGKWLYGEIGAEDKTSPHYEKVRELHARFHQAAARVAEFALAGKKAEATAQLAMGGDFADVSARLTAALLDWKRG